ncbi:hypothetical protein ACWKWU_19360 [Chitinophaga lutea]
MINDRNGALPLRYPLLLLVFALMQWQTAFSQAGTGVKIGPKDSTYLDSIKTKGYPWRFPIWGAKMQAKGFSVQYPVGAMVNYSVGTQKVSISELSVGIGQIPMTELDFVKFGEVKADLNAVTSRIDLWLLPFLDVYTILGPVWSTTNVEIVDPIQFSTKANFKGYTYGLGTTVAGGYHNIITITDINHTWTDLDKLSDKVKTWMVTPRVGYNFIFPRDRNKSIAVWVGVTGLFIKKGTSGSINVSDVTHNIPEDKLQNIVDEVEGWYQDLTIPQQRVVKEIAQKLLDRIHGNNPDGVVITYSLDKKPQSNWSMVTGAQFQFNKRWQARVEVGYLGGRTSGLLSANYRWRW